MSIIRWLAVVLALLFVSPVSKADAEATRAQLLKTAFLYNFSKFVSWPESVTETASETEESVPHTFSICIFGDLPYGGATSGLERKKIKGNDIAVMQITEESDIGACMLVYLSTPHSSNANALLNRWHSSPVLFVAESAEFHRAGGGIGMYVEDERVRFSINERAIRRHGLKVSSRLLDLAQDVIN